MSERKAAMLSTEQAFLQAVFGLAVRIEPVVSIAVGDECGQSWDCCLSHCEELGITLNPDAFVAVHQGCCDRRPPTHEWIENDALAERKRSPNNLTHERLRFQRRVWGKVSFEGARRRTPNHVTEGLVFSDSPQPTGLPLPEVVLNPPFAWLPEKPPGLPARAGHDGDVLKLLVRVFRAIASSKSLNQTNDFAPLLEASLDHGYVHKMRKERVRS